MINFKTKKTRLILVLTPFYPLGLFLFLDRLDSYLAGMYRGAREWEFYTIYEILDFLRLGNSVNYDGFYPIIIIIYLSPLYFYWIIMPIFRFIGRWIARGE